jgi:hypothetical protein
MLEDLMYFLKIVVFLIFSNPVVLLAQEPMELRIEEIKRNAITVLERENYPYVEAKVENLKVLAWYREKDERPWFVDCALVWAKLNTNVGTKWALLELARNPIQSFDIIRREWQIDFIFDGADDGIEIFDHPPTTKDLQKSVLNFKFKPESGWTRYDSFLDKTEWEACFSEVPPPSL